VPDVRVMPTGGHPVVMGEWSGAPGKPTVLLYGHFDTQPADPLEEWTTPPFEPAVRDGRVYARGASDDKGNMLVPILAVEAMLKTRGRLPVNVKFFFEGQEEIGSPQLPAFVAEHADTLAADLAVSADGGQRSDGQPILLLGLRGLCALQIDVRGPAHDLHSGAYGGTVQNPVHALVEVLGSMRGADGKILVEGFYDDVRTLSNDERAGIAEVPFDEEAYKSGMGVTELFGEPGYSTHERLWVRPTLEVNGIWGGFRGEGVKTVLPAEAHAKITCRLVPDQRPEGVVRRVAAHVEKHTPPGVTARVQTLPSTARPYLVPADHPGQRVAGRVLEELYGKKPLLVRHGASIPVCTLFREHLGIYTVIFAFGMDDENVHAPNEFYRLESFTLGQTGYARLLEELAATA
jgi:acetylornithine deacetylase/succinyl-diaminopimelate desuccinylase-like protein